MVSVLGRSCAPNLWKIHKTNLSIIMLPCAPSRPIPLPAACPTVWPHCCRLSVFLAVRARATRCWPRAAQRKNSIEKLQKRWRRRRRRKLQLPLLLPLLLLLQRRVALAKHSATCLVYCNCEVPHSSWSWPGGAAKDGCRHTHSTLQVDPIAASLMKLLIMRRMLHFSQFGCQPLSSDTLYVTCWPSARDVPKKKERKKQR